MDEEGRSYKDFMFYGQQCELIIAFFISGGFSATLYMSELILTTLRTE